MLNVFFTMDVEIWCDGWGDIDRKFSDAYNKYIFGSTKNGDYGLPYQLNVLQDHGILGTFFVEPLFSTRFGRLPLENIVGLIQEYNQEIQLHLHPEWADESHEPLIANTSQKRPYLFQYSLEEQVHLIQVGASILREIAGTDINAFRAGSFGFNVDTLRALAANQIAFDSSYNATLFGPDSGVRPGILVLDLIECEGVIEYPMTVFKDGLGKLRHVQLTACSYKEMEGLLWDALEKRRESFVILSHNFELLNPSKTQPDSVVVERFRKLCCFLQRNSDSFRTCGFQELNTKISSREPAPLSASAWKTGMRMFEQIYRRKYR